MKTILEQLSTIGIIPVIQINDPEESVPLIRALSDGGISCAEITFRSEYALQAIKDVTTELPHILVGAGTVLTLEQAKNAILAGAQFIITPGFNEEIVKWCISNNIFIIPGISSATEIEKALSYNITHVKFFPAESSGGVKKIKDLSAPYSMMHFIPTGGINLTNIHDYLSLPCVDAIGGSFMLTSDDIKQKNWDAITQNTKLAVKEMLSYKILHIGMNGESKEQAQNFAKMLCHLFNFDYYDKPKSVFAGEGFELLFGEGPGVHGHIGIYTPYPERAVYHLNKLGINIIEDSITRNKKTNKINFVYLDLDISGYKFHLINPDIKMV